MQQSNHSSNSIPNYKDLKKIKINLKSKFNESNIHSSESSGDFGDLDTPKFCLFCENRVNSYKMDQHACLCNETVNFIQVYDNRPALSVIIEGIKRKISELRSWLLMESSRFSEEAVKLTLGIHKYIRNEEDDFKDPLSPIHIYRKYFSSLLQN